MEPYQNGKYNMCGIMHEAVITITRVLPIRFDTPKFSVISWQYDWLKKFFKIVDSKPSNIQEVEMKNTLLSAIILNRWYH
jgi:hypothetical protein